jgi:heptosyltransferase-2
MPLACPLPLLVRLPSWLGDLVAAEPIVRALHGALAAEGRAHALTLAGPVALLPLLEGRFPGSPRLAHGGRGGEDPRAWAGHAAALLLTGSLRSAWLAWRAGIPERIGLFRDGRGLLLTRGHAPARASGRGNRTALLPAPLPRPVGQAYAELLPFLGLCLRSARPHLEPSPAARDTCARRLAELGLPPGRPYLLASVGGRLDSAKALDADSAAALLGPLAAELDLPLVLTGAPAEEAEVRAVEARLSARGPRPLRAFGGGSSSLPELIALARSAALFVGTDSGARHVARAAGAPTLTLLGPMDARHSAEHGERERALCLGLDCQPCGRERCPLTGPAERRCLRGFTPEVLLGAARELLELPRERPQPAQP